MQMNSCPRAVHVTKISSTPTTSTTITTRTSGAVVGGGVLSPEAVQLQPHCALPVIPRDGGTALHRRRVECETTIIINTSDPFQPLAGCLSHPLHGITAEVEPGGLADEAEPSSRHLEATPGLVQRHGCHQPCGEGQRALTEPPPHGLVESGHTQSPYNSHRDVIETHRDATETPQGHCRDFTEVSWRPQREPIEISLRFGMSSGHFGLSSVPLSGFSAFSVGSQ